MSDEHQHHLGEKVDVQLTSTNVLTAVLRHAACMVQHVSLPALTWDCPMQCRTYPFWPEPLTSRHDWEAEALRCEGIVLQSSALPRHHRYSHSATDHTLHSGATAASVPYKP